MTLFEFLTWESFAQRFQYNLSVTLWVVISSPIPLIWQGLSPIGRELIPVLYEKNYLGTAVRNFDVIKIYPNSSILPKYFCLDTPQNKALSLNQ